MIRISLRFAALVICCGFMLVTTATAQDFQKSYQLGTGGSISIRNVSGNIVVSGYDGEGVTVAAFKEGRDRDKVEVEDLSSPNRIELRARYPQNCNCDVSLRFEVRVPRSSNYNFGNLSAASGNIEVAGVKGQIGIRTASGDIMVKDVAGTINASAASGDVRVRDIVGEVNARSASGNVDVEITRLEGAQEMKFSAASGDVHVKLPANLDAEVEMSSINGSVKTDFPIEVRQRAHGPGSHASGRLGAGARRLRISSASGNVSLMRL